MYLQAGSTEPLRGAATYKAAARTAVAAGAGITIWTPGSGKRIRLLSFHVTVSAATVLTLKLGTQTVWERDFGAAGGADVLLPLNGILGAEDATLTLISSGAATIGATAVGVEE